MTILELMDAVMNDYDTEIELYSIEEEETVFDTVYDGFQPRDCIPEIYWDEIVDSFQFDKNYICINF